jgi:hypothetical protein
VTVFRWSANTITSVAWVALREVGVGVEQGVAVGVLGEEGQHAAGALGPCGQVVLLQCRVGAQCMTAWKSRLTTIRDERARAPRPGRHLRRQGVPARCGRACGMDVTIGQATQDVCTALVGRRTDTVAIRGNQFGPALTDAVCAGSRS